MVAHVRASCAPRVSVLIPTYNYGRFLWQAIESALAQDFTDFELIISDDNSSDESAEIIAEFARRDPRIRATVQPRNLGMVANWNWCLHEARGDYVKYMFGDDCFVETDALSRLVAALDAEPSAALAASARLLIDEDARPVAVCDDFGAAGRHDGLSAIRRCMRDGRNLIGEPSAVLFRRVVPGRGFDPSLRQAVDQEFWFHLLLRGDLVYLPEPLCAFRRHAQPQTPAPRRDDLGPAESLLVTERYIEAMSNPHAGGFSPWARRSVLYHALYHSQKEAPRTAAVLMAEAAVRAQLPLHWRCLLWLWHRLTKPASDLRRLFHRRTLRQSENDSNFEPIGRNVGTRAIVRHAGRARACPGAARAADPMRKRPELLTTRRQLSPAASFPSDHANAAV